jgi:uncharacterized YigZ family protein
VKTIDKKIYQNAFEIKKSHFITIATQVTSKSELNEFLNNYVSKDARHNCYAYRIGIEQQLGGFSDDGEPTGTAGKPIFNVIEKMNLTNIVVLVIRHFGGIKLGAGPLTRAYTTSASDLLNNIELLSFKKTFEITFSFSIEQTKIVDAFLRKNSLSVIEKTYLNEPTYSLLCDDLKLFANTPIKFNSFKKQLTYITAPLNDKI